MTVGHLIEMFVGKWMVMDPQRFWKRFSMYPLRAMISKILKPTTLIAVFRSWKKMVDSITGKFIGEAFVGMKI